MVNRLEARATERRTRRPVLDGRAWIVVWLLALLVVTGVVVASSAFAQTDDPAPATELGEDLDPPTHDPTDESVQPEVQVRAVCAHEPEAILKPNDLTLTGTGRHALPAIL